MIKFERVRHELIRENGRPVGYYQFYRGMHGSNTVTIRVMGGKPELGELFNGTELNGENVIARFDHCPTIESLVEKISVYLDAEVDFPYNEIVA